MKCVRCGFCCFVPWVAIVKDPEAGPIPDNLEMHWGKGRCPHLDGQEPGKYSCKVHDLDWYKDSPCGRHRDDREGECQRGLDILRKFKEWKEEHPGEEWGWQEFVEAVKEPPHA